MDTEGFLSPTDIQSVQSAYDELAGAAQTVVRETARAMAFDPEEFDERVTTDVVMTVHDALFASLLDVRIGTVEEFDAWLDEHDYEVRRVGGENVDNVVWHVAPVDNLVVAATFQRERDAAIATLRRQAWGQIYREKL